MRRQRLAAGPRAWISQEGAGTIRLIYLELENYRRFRSARLEFPDGVIGIMGANGSGKSTLIEAISWVLFGSVSVDRTDKEGIRFANADPGEDCSATLIFELGGVQYQVQRTIRGRSLRADAQMMGDGEMLASGERPVTKQVEKVLGMDHHAFFNSVFTRQKDLSALSGLPPAERKKLIIRMLDLDVLQGVIDEMRRDEREERRTLEYIREQLLAADGSSRLKALEGERAKLDEELISLKLQLTSANEDVKRLEVELERAKEHREQMAKRDESHRWHELLLSEKRSELRGLVRQREGLMKEIADLKGRLTRMPELKARYDEYEALNKAKDAMEERRGPHEDRKKLAGELQRVEGEIARLEKDLDNTMRERRKLKAPQESLERVAENMASLDSDILRIRGDISATEGRISSLRDDLNGLRDDHANILSLGPDGTCPTCQRALGDHHTHLLSSLNDRQEEVGASIKAHETKASQAKEELGTLQKRRRALEDRKVRLQADDGKASELDVRSACICKDLDHFREQHASLKARLRILGDDDFDEGEFQSLKMQLQRLHPEVIEYQRLSVEGDRLPGLLTRSTELEADISIQASEEQRLQDELTAIGYIEGDLNKAQMMYDGAVLAHEKGRGEITLKGETIKHAKRRVEDKDKVIAEVMEMEQDAKARAGDLQGLIMLIKVMIDFRQNVMERITPTLSEIASDLFDTITDSRYGGVEVDDDYNVHVYDGGVRYPLSRFSGGENDLANLCLRLAISRVLTDRSGNDLNFLVLDEIFGSQDQVRKRAIMETLNRLEKRFHQIILISHIDDTKDMMSNVVTVRELEDGTSDLVI